MLNISEIGQRIDLIRRQKGWTQEQLASALTLSQPAVSKYLKTRIPPAETLLRLAQIGNTTVEWILTGQKSYFYQDNPPQVSELQESYDADIQLSRKIAALPAEIRQAIMTIIDHMQNQGK